MSCKISLVFALLFLAASAITTYSVGQIAIKDTSKSLLGTTVNSALSTTRSETYSVLWNGDDPLPNEKSTFIGIRSLNFLSTVVDFEVKLSSAAHTTNAATASFQITAGANSNIGLIEHFIFVASDPRIVLVNYDFGAASTFTSTFSTSTNAELTYTIPFTTSALDLFQTGATAYVSFTRVKFAQSCVTYKLDYEIVEVTMSSVVLKIKKLGNTVLEALKGQILIISSDAINNLGFALTTVTTPAFTAGAKTNTAEDVLAVDVTEYYGAPEMFYFLKKFNFESFLNFQTEGELSIDSSNQFKSFLAVTQGGTSLIKGLEYIILTFCKRGMDCKTTGFAPEVIAGEANIQTFTGTSLATSTSSVRTFQFNIAFKRFLATTPTNFAVGVISGDTTMGFSTSVVTITESSVTIQVAAPANVAISKLKVSYIASLWEGLQIVGTTFTPNSVTGGSTRTFTQDITYFTSTYLSPPEAFVIFSEVDVDTPSSQIILDSQMITSGTSGMSGYVRMEITLTATLGYNSLKGAVIIYQTSSLNTNKMDTKMVSVTPSSTYSESTTQLVANVDYAYTPFVFNYLKSFNMPCGAFTMGANKNLHNYYVAASSCHGQWLYGVEDSCASSAFEYQVFTLPSYSTSAGAEYNVFQGAGSICVGDSSITGGTTYTIAVTDEAEWNGIFRFKKEMRAVPRFIQTFFSNVILVSTGIGRLAISSPNIQQSGFVTYNIHTATLSSDWNLAGYGTEYMHDLHDASSTEVPETAVGSFGYNSADLFRAKDWYTDVVATKILKHYEYDDFHCTVQVTFTGIIKALYVNSKFILAGSSVDPAVSVTLTSEVDAEFLANTGSYSPGAVVTVFGNRLEITNLAFINCLTTLSSGIAPTWVRYVVGSPISKNFYVTTTDVACGTGCLSCKDSTTCYECKSTHFLLGSSCVYNCNHATSFVAVKNKFCQSKFANLGLQLSATSYSAGSLTFSHLVDSFNSDYGSYTLIYPKAITTQNYPLIIDDNTKPLVLAEGPSDGSPYPVGEFRTTTISKTVSVKNIAVAANLDITLITFNLYLNYFSFFTVLAANPKVIGYRQLTPYGNAVTSISTSDTYQAHTLIYCPIYCSLTVEFNGQLEVIRDHATIMFSGTHATQESYTLITGLSSGIRYLTFKGSGSTYFKFTVGGSTSKRIYAPISILYQETYTLPVSSSTPVPNCYNGGDGQCYSCEASYYLDFTRSSCIADCTTIDGVDVDNERLCDYPTITPGTSGGGSVGTTGEIPAAIENLHRVDEVRQVSNEVFSVVSSLVVQGIHSIRSQTVQGPLGYFMFLNIKFPKNYLQYAALNEDSSFPNPWEEDETEEISEEIQENDFNSQSNIDAYLEDQTLAVNIGETMIYILVCALIIPFYEGVFLLVMKHKRPEAPIKWYHNALKRGSVSLRWSFLMNQLISKYQDITFFVFLGIYNAGRGENTDPGNTVGCVFGFILVFVILVGLFFLMKMICKAFREYSEQDIEKEKFKEDDYLSRRMILFKDLKKEKLMSLLYTFFVVLRIFGFCFCVVFISSVVGIQLAFLNISSFLILAYLLYYKPFDEREQLGLTLAYEIDFYLGVFAATLLQIYISAGGDNESTKYGFGYAIIAADVGMTVLNFVSFGFDMKEYLEMGFVFAKNYYLKKKFRENENKKVTPLSVGVKHLEFKVDDAPSTPGIATPGMRRLLKFDMIDSATPDIQSPNTSTSKMLFHSNINNDPRKSSWKNSTFANSVMQAREENDDISVVNTPELGSPYDTPKANGWDNNSFINRKIQNLKNRQIRASVKEQVFGFDPETDGNYSENNVKSGEQVVSQDL